MNTTGANARKSKQESVNEEVPPQVPQGPQAPNKEGAIPYLEIRAAPQTLTQLMTTQAQVVTTQTQVITDQAKGGVESQVNPIASTSASRIRYFIRMNPLTFHDDNLDKDPQGLTDKVFKVVDAFGVNLGKKAEIVA